MTPPINFDGTNENYSSVTIDGQTVEQITIDGQDVLSAIPPDTGLLHDWEASNFDGTTWADQQGAVDLSAQGDPTLETSGINGEPAVLLDGVDDYFSATGPNQSSPMVWFFVVDFDDDGTISPGIDDSSDRDITFLYRYDLDPVVYRLGAGGAAFEGGAPTTSAEITTAVIDGSDSKVRKNGSDDVTGTLNSSTLNDILLGKQEGQSRFANGYISRVLIYDKSQMNTGQISNVEDYLNSIYGVY
jgi:hypothetical protein